MSNTTHPARVAPHRAAERSGLLVRVVLAGLVFAAAVVLAAAEVWPAVAALSVAHALAVTDLGLRVARRAPS